MLDEVREEELNEAPPSIANRQGSPSGARPVGQHELEQIPFEFTHNPRA